MSMSISHRGFVVALFAMSVPVLASATGCPQHFAQGKPPAIVQPNLKTRTQEVCFISYAVLHSGVSRTPLYAAEHLKRDNLLLAKDLSRKDSFHAEDDLPKSDRAELADYQRSGYDRGHLAPNADMPNRDAQRESFSLANMVPQIHANNAGVWANLESTARQLATEEGELYVVSGPAFLGNNIKKVGNVLVPTHLWKAMYSPKQQRAGAYLITNDETKEYKAISLVELEKMVGLNVLPTLSIKVRESGMVLPKATSQRGDDMGGNKPPPPNKPAEEHSNIMAIIRAILEFILKLMQK